MDFLNAFVISFFFVAFGIFALDIIVRLCERKDIAHLSEKDEVEDHRAWMEVMSDVTWMNGEEIRLAFFAKHNLSPWYLRLPGSVIEDHMKMLARECKSLAQIDIRKTNLLFNRYKYCLTPTGASFKSRTWPSSVPDNKRNWGPKIAVPV